MKRGETKVSVSWALLYFIEILLIIALVMVIVSLAVIVIEEVFKQR